MKHFASFIALMVISITAMAQVGGISYTPYVPRSESYSTPYTNSHPDPFPIPYVYESQPSQSQPQSKPQRPTTSLTAYSVGVYGTLHSTQIRVVEQSPTSAYSVDMVVVAKYVTGGATGGYWQELPTDPTVYKCSHYSSDPLEKRFMYKAMIGSGYVYFYY